MSDVILTDVADGIAEATYSPNRARASFDPAAPAASHESIPARGRAQQRR